VAEDEGLNLTALVGRIGRSPGAVRDYLGWLLGVDVLRVARKRYFFVDPVVRWWVRLHARGTAAREAEIAAAAREVIHPAVESEAAAGEPATTASAPGPTPALPRADTLMEID
jgi:hypothetical protein